MKKSDWGPHMNMGKAEEEEKLILSFPHRLNLFGTFFPTYIQIRREWKVEEKVFSALVWLGPQKK